MTIFPMSKACLGLSITRDSLCLVEIQRTWRGNTCRHISERILPPELIRLSPARPNISNLQEFTRILGDLVSNCKLPQSVALSLPDLCGRTTVLPFSSFPSKKSERDSIMRWRFQQAMNISIDNTRLAYRVFDSSKTQSEPTHILATAVHHDIIEQYEQACLEVGLLPNSVGLAGLDVFDFYRSYIQETQRVNNQRRSDLGNECLFLYLANWGFSFMAFHHGHPTFVRVKALPIPRLNQETVSNEADQMNIAFDETNDHNEDGAAHQNLDHYSSLDINNVANELVATLQYYFETLQYTRENGESIPLYFAEGLPQGEHLLPTDLMIQNMLKTSMSHPPTLMVMKFSDRLSPKMNTMIMKSTPQMTSFSAFASVMVL